MSEYQVLTIFAAFLFVYSLIASRLERMPVNGALVYVAVGMLLGPQALGLVDLNVDGEGIKRVAELTLALCLFTDSSNANLTVLRSIEAIPMRLLLMSPVRFGNHHPPRRLRSVRSALHPRMKIPELLLQAFARVLRPHHPVDSGQGIPPQSEECLSEPLSGNVVKKRCELRLPILPCYLAYTIQRTWHVMVPALCPGRVLLVRVPLGQAPSLHDFRFRLPGFVRPLRRYYGPV
ncbi:MAG: hypothetical protein E4H03_14330 [Myxococcales bacterium]|nr:MAG: hypothetical protein E4H03_14330 [Myxococcales bacterium]